MSVATTGYQPLLSPGCLALVAAASLCASAALAAPVGRARQHMRAADAEPDLCRALAVLATHRRLDLQRVEGDPGELSAFESGELAGSPFTVVADPFSLPVGPLGEKIRFVGVEGHAQCASRVVRAVDQVLPSLTDSSAGRWSELEAADPGNDDYAIQFRRQYFLVTARRGDANQPQRIARILANGSMQPLCRLRQTPPALSVGMAAAPALCRAVTDGTAQHFPWEAWTPPDDGDANHPTFGSRYGADAEGTQRGLVQIFRGPPVPVGRFRSAPNPSACDTQAGYWLEELTPDSSRSAASPLDGSGATDIYQFHGKDYVFQRDADGPRLVDYSSPAPVTLCRFGETTETRVDAESAESAGVTR